MQHSRSAISVASIISVVASEPHRCYDRHILIGIDNSLLQTLPAHIRALSSTCHASTLPKNSKEALEWAVTHLYRTGDKFHLIHVIPEPPTMHAWPGVYIPPDDAMEREEFRESTVKVKEAFAPIVNTAKVPTDVHLIVSVDAPDTIASLLMEKADELGAACFVVASHGKAKLQEFWMGSVTRSLLKRSRLPVVVYRR